MKGTQVLSSLVLAMLFATLPMLVAARRSLANEPDRVAIATERTGTMNYVAAELRGRGHGIGLGAWTIDVSYDPSVVTLSGCLPNEASVCIVDRTPGVARITGASAYGLSGDFTLATLVFRCGASPSASNLALQVEVWAYSTVAAGDFSSSWPDVIDGHISCLAPAPNAAPVVAALPSTGSADAEHSSPFWPIFAFAALGAISIAIAFALRAQGRASSPFPLGKGARGRGKY